MPGPTSTFEPGFDPVVRLEFPERIHRTTVIEIGRRENRVRVESGDDRAWEFDAAGRLIVAQEDSLSLHATFDGRIWGHRIVGAGPGRRLMDAQGPEDPFAWICRIHQRIARWAAAAPSTATWSRGSGADAAEFARAALALPAGRSAGVLQTEFARAREIWERVPVLPPDQYEALVIQISEGCPWDRCHFCALYRDQPYRERSLEEIVRHLDQVMVFLGASASRVRRVFLGQANALLRPTGELLEIFELIRRRISVPDPRMGPREQRMWLRAHLPSADGFYAFVDAFHRPRPVEDWKALASAGLRRVYIGLESGDVQRLRELGKPLDPSQAIDMVENLHAAGLGVGVILMTGIASTQDEERHRVMSAGVLDAMQLRAGDQVYLSPLVASSGAPLEAIEVGEGDVVQSGPALTRMRETLRAHVGRGVPIAEYDLDRLGARTPRG
jgi:hypothetical protein